mgnify:FL=1
MIQEYFIESDCPDYSCTYDVYIEVAWTIADLSFDHEFGTFVEYTYEVDDVVVSKFVAYDLDGEIEDKFDIESISDRTKYKKDRVYKHSKIIDSIVEDYLRELEPPEIMEDE